MESEANMFAAELLMPWNWIATLIRAEPNVATIHVRICHDCDVSPIAAAITLARALVGDYIYAAERDGVVEFSGKTKSTAAPRPTTLAKLSENAYEYSEAHYATAFAGRLLHWWKLPAEIVLAADDNRSWRELLHLILVDIGTPQDKLVHAARSINGVIAAANGAAKLKGITSQAGIVAVCVQRMRDRNEFADFVSHPMFDTFISKRSSDFVSNNASLG
jgi:hypothetical protein